MRSQQFPGEMLEMNLISRSDKPKRTKLLYSGSSSALSNTRAKYYLQSARSIFVLMEPKNAPLARCYMTGI